MMPPPNDRLARAAAEHRLTRAEARVETAVVSAMRRWLAATRAAILTEANNLTAAAWPAARAVDAATAAYGVWRQQLEATILPTLGIVMGEAFQQQRRANPDGAFWHQQQYMATVLDRLRIWPEGAFEDLRPELLEALSDADSIDDITDRIGRLLDIDATTRDLRARIGDIDKELDADDLDPGREALLRARRRLLWNAHDQSLNEWRWKARRIARTETHGAVQYGQLAAARREEALTGDVLYKRWLCVPGDTRVAAFGTTHVARRHYEGPAITIRTASGRSVTLTPQHEVLTGRGWIPAQEVRKEDHLFHVGEGDSVRAPDIERGDPMIAEVFDATVAAKPVEVRPVPAGVDLDSERSTEQYVHVELVDRALADDLAEGLQRRGDFSLVDADGLAQVAGFSRGDTYRFVGGPLVPGNTCEGDSALPCFDFGSFAAGAGESGGRSIADGDAAVLQYPSDNLLAASDGACYFGSGDPGLIEADDVVLIEVSAFCGHVYDLSTVGEWFAADSLIVHNSTEDSRTRVTHAVADGQMVRLGEKFRVGGFLLDHPGDPITIAPHETINCRCSMVILDGPGLQRELQGPDSSLGRVEPGGRRLGPDDPDVARAAAEALAEDRKQGLPPDRRGEHYGQEPPTVEPRTPVPFPAPILDAPADLTDLSDDQLIELMVAANSRDDLDLYERVDAEFDRRADLDDAPEPEPDDDPDDADALLRWLRAEDDYKDKVDEWLYRESVWGQEVLEWLDAEDAWNWAAAENRWLADPLPSLPKLDDAHYAARDKYVADIQRSYVDAKFLDEKQADRLGAGLVLEYEAGRVNPDYRSGEEYQINCQRCIMANELRRRGYAVEAAPNYQPEPDEPGKRSTMVTDSPPFPYPMDSYTRWLYQRKWGGEKYADDVNLVDFADLWRNKDGTERLWEQSAPGKLPAKLRAEGIGARGWCSIRWKAKPDRPPSANVFSWEVVPDPETGKPTVVFHDAQNNDVDVADYLRDGKLGSLRWMRVDDLMPTQQVADLDLVVPARVP